MRRQTTCKAQTKDLREERRGRQRTRSPRSRAPTGRPRSSCAATCAIRHEHIDHRARGRPRTDYNGRRCRRSLPCTAFAPGSASTRRSTDHLKATLLLATGGDDPRSSNQTLDSSGHAQDHRHRPGLRRTGTSRRVPTWSWASSRTRSSARASRSSSTGTINPEGVAVNVRARHAVRQRLRLVAGGALQRQPGGRQRRTPRSTARSSA